VLAAIVLVGALIPGAAAAPAAQESCSFPVSATDATATELTVEEPPERVVTLAPSAAQTMKEIGAWETVVGVSGLAAYLEGADEKANVSSGQGISVEKVVAQEPDLVLAPNVVPDETVEQLRDSGLTVYKFAAATSMDDVVDKTALTGELVGECEGASETVDRMNERLSTIEEAVEDVERPRAVYVFFGYTAGNNTFVGNMIERAGAVNLAAEAGIEGFQQISDEVIAEEDPEWLILNSEQPEPPGSDAYQESTAVQEGNVVVIDTNVLNQPAPRSIEAITQMVEAFHPEAYEQAKATPTPTATPTEDETATPTEDTPTPEAVDDTPPETESPTETGDSPGFGAVAALVAALAAVLLARRQ
jgi:iron complex transport system substrate-binding protein